MSITESAIRGTATLIWETSESAFIGPPDVELPGGVEHQQPGLLDGDPGVGDPLAVAAEVDQRLPEGGAVEPAADAELQRRLGEPDQPHAVVDPAGAEPALRDRERLAGPGQDVA